MYYLNATSALGTLRIIIIASGIIIIVIIIVNLNIEMINNNT